MAVVATFELNDEIALSDAAGEADGAHGRFGAAGNEANFFDEGNRFGDQSRKLQFEFSGDAETCAAPRLLGDGPADRWMRMTQQHRPPRADVIEKLVAIGIVKVLPASLFDDQGLATHGTKRANRAVDAADKHFFRLFKNFPRTAAFGFCLRLCRTHRGTFFMTQDFSQRAASLAW